MHVNRLLQTDFELKPRISDCTAFVPAALVLRDSCNGLELAQWLGSRESTGRSAGPSRVTAMLLLFTPFFGACPRDGGVGPLPRGNDTARRLLTF
jgi:hypothetical protein